MKRRFYVTFTAEVEIDDRVFKPVLTDKWRKQFYLLNTREQAAAHIAYNLVRGAELSQLDGFANLPNTCAKLVEFRSEDAEESLE